MSGILRKERPAPEDEERDAAKIAKRRHISQWEALDVEILRHVFEYCEPNVALYVRLLCCKAWNFQLKRLSILRFGKGHSGQHIRGLASRTKGLHIDHLEMQYSHEHVDEIEPILQSRGEISKLTISGLRENYRRNGGHTNIFEVLPRESYRIPVFQGSFCDIISRYCSNIEELETDCLLEAYLFDNRHEGSVSLLRNCPKLKYTPRGLVKLRIDHDTEPHAAELLFAGQSFHISDATFEMCLKHPYDIKSDKLSTWPNLRKARLCLYHKEQLIRFSNVLPTMSAVEELTIAVENWEQEDDENYNQDVMLLYLSGLNPSNLPPSLETLRFRFREDSSELPQYCLVSLLESNLSGLSSLRRISLEYHNSSNSFSQPYFKGHNLLPGDQGLRLFDEMKPFLTRHSKIEVKIDVYNDGFDTRSNKPIFSFRSPAAPSYESFRSITQSGFEEVMPRNAMVEI